MPLLPLGALLARPAMPRESRAHLAESCPTTTCRVHSNSDASTDLGDGSFDCGGSRCCDSSFVSSPRSCSSFDNNFHEVFQLEERVIGAGGYGTVRLARRRGDAADACYYAVKIVSKSDPKASRLARQEAEYQRQLEHPAICPLVDMFEDEDNVYLVLEYIEGHDVFDEVVAKGEFGEAVAAEIIRQLIEALEYCHLTKVMIHRDIKPENIMLTSNGAVQLIDFGLAQDASLEIAQPSVGTDAYLAPETAFGEYGPASDMWSVGKVLCFMLFGGSTASGWDELSCEARDFVASLLCENAAGRLTASQALGHPWLQQQTNRPALRRMATD
jgi:serine/threonine protein kinase